MSQQLAVLATKPHDLSFISGIHMVEEEKQTPAGCPLTPHASTRKEVNKSN